jgi:hypothetical protein
MLETIRLQLSAANNIFILFLVRVLDSAEVRNYSLCPKRNVILGILAQIIKVGAECSPDTN